MNFYTREQIECPRTGCPGVLVEIGPRERGVARLRCNICHAKTMPTIQKFLTPEK